MNQILLWTMLLVPLLLAAAVAIRADSPMLTRLIPWAAIPAVLLTLIPPFQIEVPWLLLDSRLGVDAVGRVFLGVTAVLWLAAGWYASVYMANDGRRGAFQFFFLLTMMGNLGVTVAQDGASFLTFFTVMSLAAYGLIIHDHRASSTRAARVYLMMTIGGEMLLFMGLVTAYHETGTLVFSELSTGLALSPRRDVVLGLLLAGWGIKLGVMPLHGWLPLAHPAAPTPASAVLSGAMIKTGLLGCLRVLPLGMIALPTWSDTCLVLGLLSCLLAALIGMSQRNPKAVLAYSSVSQMGLVTVCLGAALVKPQAWPAMCSALLVWVVHHGVAKAALFFGVGIAGARMPSKPTRYLISASLVLAALSLAGLPGTMGFAAKTALKYSTANLESWNDTLAWLLPLTSVTTTLLVSRYLWLVWPGRHAMHGRLSPGMVLPWSGLSVAVVAGFFVIRWHPLVDPAWTTLSLSALWSAIGPILIGGAVVGMVIWIARILPTGTTEMLAARRIPEGDFVIPLIAVIYRLRRRWYRAATIQLPQSSQRLQRIWAEQMIPLLSRSLDRITRTLENDIAAGLFLILMALIMLLISMH